jgi:hypothetical protein
MNPYHAWKFMLSILTFWLAFALASPAQSCPACADVPACVMNGNTCQIPVDSNGGASNTCVILNNTSVTEIEWVTTSAGCQINFANGMNPVSNGTPICGTPYPITAQSGNGSSCYQYSIDMTSGAKHKSDPIVVVQCNASPSNCKTGDSKHK